MSDIDTDSAIIKPTRPTELSNDRPIPEKSNPSTKSDLAHKRKTELRILNSAYDNYQSSDNFQVNLLHEQPCADLFGENVYG